MDTTTTTTTTTTTETEQKFDRNLLHKIYRVIVPSGELFMGTFLKPNTCVYYLGPLELQKTTYSFFRVMFKFLVLTGESTGKTITRGVVLQTEKEFFKHSLEEVKY